MAKNQKMNGITAGFGGELTGAYFGGKLGEFIGRAVSGERGGELGRTIGGMAGGAIDLCLIIRKAAGSGANLPQSTHQQAA